ncbi:signal transduction protein [Rhodosalinus halophilus]|uniref:Signal transduction protein n=1 Tax=Rhodosalinus halophilus TaxID=2259333 RepID=A0A365U491_9RHOB|nr:CBS domain-containing protein [Rhodosalinus halophilus]RBI82924.1 signal transduction protein [Rhodosalinus halophilus]
MTASTHVGMQLRDRPEYASKPAPLTFRADASVAEAVAAMSDRGYGSVIVTDQDGTVTGVVTERDVMRRLVNAGRDAQDTRLQQIMTREIRVAQETDEMLDWLRIMSNERFRRLPVVDEDGRIKAVFTQGDFVSYTWPDLLYQARELTKASFARNYALWLIVGGIMLYSVLMVIVVGSL